MTHSGDGLAADTRRRIDTFLDEQLVEWNAPGASLAVFDGDGVCYANGYGARSIHPVEPATPDSLFHVASVTKSFTAIALLQFVEQGDLALDDAVADYVEFLGDAPGDPVTVGELLTHSSGIPSDVGRQGGHIAGMADFVRRFDRWAGQRLTDRDRLMYLNRGYVVLGALVAAIAGRPYAEHVTESVLDPMGMDRSTFDPGAIEDDPDAMEGYVDGDGGEVEPTEVDPAEFPAIREGLYGAGGLISTVSDLAAVGPLLLSGGTVDGEQVLDPSTVEGMCRPQSPPARTVDGYDVHFGHGWLVEDLLGDRLVYGGGGVPGYSTVVGVLPEHELGVALGINSSAPPKIDVAQGVLAIACGEDPFDAVRYLRATRAVERASGSYEATRTDATATVEPAGGGGSHSLNTKIEVTIPDRDLSFRAAFEGETTGGECVEGVTFASEMGHGFRWVVEFLETGEGWTMLWSRNLRTVRFEGR